MTGALTTDAATPADCDSVAHLLVDRAVLEGGDQFGIEPNALHHLQRVLRVGTGEVVTLTDGCGHWVETVVGSQFAAGYLERVSALHRLPARTVRTEVAFALTKSDKPDLVVQKLTELGTAVITMFAADRSVVRWDADKAARNLVRFEAIAREAVQQSRQVWLPTLQFAAALDTYRNGSVSPTATLLRCDRGGDAALARFEELRRSGVASVTVAVGPEGGWSDRERAALPATVGLAGPVLRAETAAMVAGAFLTAVFDA